jgi:hypothetical protein
MKRCLILFCAFAFSACAQPPIASAPTNGTSTAGLGQVANVGRWTIKPIAVIEDSRCPQSVQCVWAGRLVLRARTNAGAGADLLDLTLGEPHKMGNAGFLTLVDARPSKLTPGTIDPREYRFTFALGDAP